MSATVVETDELEGSYLTDRTPLASGLFTTHHTRRGLL